jgi:hypothetical protein
LESSDAASYTCPALVCDADIHEHERAAAAQLQDTNFVLQVEGWQGVEAGPACCCSSDGDISAAKKGTWTAQVYVCCGAVAIRFERSQWLQVVDTCHDDLLLHASSAALLLL